MIRISRRVSSIYLSLAIFVSVTTTPTLAAPPNVDPCTLLTIAEVEQLIGKLKERPSGDKEGQASWCNYEFANGKDAMEVWVFPAEAINRGRKVSKNPVPIGGLGDDAFMDRGMHGINYVNLFVKKGGATVKLSIRETAGDEEKLKTLARTALNRF